jgi:DNA-binding response OmpR family regulator
MAAVKLLLVEDDPAIARSLTEGLSDDGHSVHHVSTGEEAIAVLDDHQMVLLDLGLPDIDGREVCRVIRQRSAVPIIMITARGDEFDRVLGLELGADDYITKPFSMREVLARLRAVARRTSPPGVDATGRADSAQQIGPLSIDRRTRKVSIGGEPVQLTVKEFDVLCCLADDAGAVRTRTEIIDRVWDMNWFGPTKTLDAHVAGLRKKLGDPRWIEAVRGVGFRLEIPSPP